MNDRVRRIYDYEDIDWARRWAGHSTLGRLLNQIDHRDPSGCWLWTTGVDKQTGYARATLMNKTYNVHRVMFRLYYGEVPDGQQLDHVCRNRTCVNPEHLEPVTQRENIMRGQSPASRAARATHCPAGHPYVGDNLEKTRDGSRRCRECRRRKQREAYAATRNERTGR